MKFTNSFTVSILGLLSLIILGLTKGTDVSLAIVGVITSYVGSRAAQKGSYVFSASRDPAASTLDAIAAVEGNKKS
jgi:hypothetical protein